MEDKRENKGENKEEQRGGVNTRSQNGNSSDCAVSSSYTKTFDRELMHENEHRASEILKESKDSSEEAGSAGEKKTKVSLP